jgi:flavin reductase (DIM6/NTAB) family NADH-FMN oxidoreductase RutF
MAGVAPLHPEVPSAHEGHRHSVVAVTTADDFGELVSGLEYPMFLLTVRAADGEPSGCLVGFASQASIRPPRMLVLVSRLNHTFEVLQRAEGLALHFLHQDDEDLAHVFGEETGDLVDKFAACEWRDGPLGVPILAGTRGWIVGRVRDRWDAGDHVAHLVDVDFAATDRPGGQLGFQMIHDMRPGHPA